MYFISLYTYLHLALDLLVLRSLLAEVIKLSSRHGPTFSWVGPDWSFPENCSEYTGSGMGKRGEVGAELSF